MTKLFTTHGCSLSTMTEKELRRNLKKLHTLMGDSQYEQATFHLNVEKHQRDIHPYETHIQITLPTGSVETKEEGDTVVELITRGFARIMKHFPPVPAL